MKELIIIIKPEKLETLKTIIDDHKCNGMTISTVMGCGAQKGYVEETSHELRGMTTTINLLPKVQVSVVTTDEKASELITDICEKVSSGKVGDGKIFVRKIEDAIRIRTGERGDKVL